MGDQSSQIYSEEAHLNGYQIVTLFAKTSTSEGWKIAYQN